MSARPRLPLLLLALAACPAKEPPPPAPPPPPAFQPRAAPLDLTKRERIATPTDASGKAFGASVAIEGDLLAVGSPGLLLSHLPGAVYVFTRSPAGWGLTTKLTANQKESSCDELGKAVALEGTVLVAGGKNCAVVFERGAVGWKQAALLEVADAESYGEHVAIAGDTVLVSDDWLRIGDILQAGAVFAYRLGPDGWKQEARLTASPVVANETFGSDVAAHGGTVVIGARQAMAGGTDAVGAAHLFERQGTAWTEVLAYQPPGNPSFATLGHSVASDGDVALAGSLGMRRAQVFERSAGTWKAAGSLDAPAPEEGRENFGAKVALRGDTGAIAAIPLSDDLSIPLRPGTNTLDEQALAARHGPRGGRVLIYQRGPDGWRNSTTLSAPDSHGGDDFGRAIAFSADSLVVGAPGNDGLFVYGPAAH